MSTVAQAQGIEPRSYHRKNPRWYHSHIIDWMMANPNGKLEDCAKFVGKTQATLSAIIRSDMFQAALAQRKAQYAARQDLVLTEKLTEVSIASLDTILDVIKTKRQAIPLDQLNSVADGALKRLGYGVEKPGAATNVQVNVSNQPQQVVVPVALADLEAARQLARQNQQRIASTPSSPSLAAEAGGSAALIEAEILADLGAGQAKGPEEGEAVAPAPVRT